MGTPYPNNPNGGEVNGLQANMAALIILLQTILQLITSAGSIGAFTLAYAYNLEGLNSMVLSWIHIWLHIELKL